MKFKDNIPLALFRLKINSIVYGSVYGNVTGGVLNRIEEAKC